MLEQVVRHIVPVESFAQERVKKRSADRPEVGLRWGRAATFDIENEEQDPGNQHPDRWERHLEEYVIGHEVHRDYDTVQIESTGGQVFQTESIRAVTFFIDEREEFVWERRPDRSIPRGSVAVFDEVRVITRRYARFSFPPSAQSIGEGLRGERPPEPTPEPEEASWEFDIRYG